MSSLIRGKSKAKQMNITKQKQIHRYREQTSGSQWGEGNGELLFNEIRISVWVDEKALKMDSGDDCPAIGMHLMPLNCTF